MWVRKVMSIAGACALGAGCFIGGTVITPPSLMRLALADDAENPDAADDSCGATCGVGTTPVGGVPAPADVAAAALLPGMDPGSLTENPDGSLAYHGTTPIGVDTPGWSTIVSPDSLIQMVRGPVAPAPPAAGPPQSPTAESYPAEGTVSLPEGVPEPEGTVSQP